MIDSLPANLCAISPLFLETFDYFEHERQVLGSDLEDALDRCTVIHRRRFIRNRIAEAPRIEERRRYIKRGCKTLCRVCRDPPSRTALNVADQRLREVGADRKPALWPAAIHWQPPDEPPKVGNVLARLDHGGRTRR